MPRKLKPPQPLLVCEICDESPARLHKILEKVLCEECMEDPENKLIVKSHARRDYFVSDKDLEPFECFYSTMNTQYKRNQEITLYRESDVINCLCAKHGVHIGQLDDLLENLKGIRKDRSKKISKAKKESRNEREKNLKKAMKKKGLEIRPDSKLCLGYIDGSIKDWTIPRIVKRMCQMKFLYEYTDIDKWFRKAKQERREEREYGDRSDFTLLDIAEMYAIEHVGGYPKKWPWLNDDQTTESGSDSSSE